MTGIAKIFMSDMHLGDGGPSDDFTNAKEKAFCDLLDKFSADYDVGSELILLGDIFDLIEQGGEDENGRIDFEKAIDSVMDEHLELLRACKIWMDKGNKIFYITGNHDHALRWPNINQRVINKLQTLTDKPLLWNSFMISDWYASQSFKIYAEHGNRFDVENNHNGQRDCFGNIIVKKFLRPLKTERVKLYLTELEWEPELAGLKGPNPFQYIDNIRPRGYIVPMIDRLIGSGHVRPGAKEILKNQLLDIYQENPSLSGLDSFFLKHMRSLVSDTRFITKMHDHYLPYRKSAKQMMDPADEHNVMRMRDLSFVPEFIIMGHTHFYDEYKVSDSCTYLNLASWLDTVFTNEKGEFKDCMNNQPVLVFAEGESSPFRIFNCRQGDDNTTVVEELVWEELMARREEYGID